MADGNSRPRSCLHTDDRVQAQNLAQGSSTPRAVSLRARFHSLLMLGLWMTTLPRSSDTLAPPPHERVCPGPLDEGNSALCQASGKAQFEIGALLVRLADGNVVIKAKRVEGFFGVGMAEFVTVDGTAVQGKQFVRTSGTLSWRHGDGQPKSISLPLNDTGAYEPGTYRTTFYVRLVNASGLALGSLTVINVTVINSNAKTGTLSLPSQALIVSESAVWLQVPVSRKGGSDCTATVSYRTVPFPGGPTNEYGPEKRDQYGSITWDEGDGNDKIISLPIIDDEIPTPFPGTRFYVELHESGCAPIGVHRVLVTITDNDLVGLLSLVPSITRFSDDGFVVIPISRVGGSASPVTLDYYYDTVGTGTILGQHFAPPPIQSLIWLHNDITTKYINVTIPGGAWWNGLEYSKSFSFRVKTVINTNMKDGLMQTMVTIVDSKGSPGRIGFKTKFPCRKGPNAPSGNCYYAAEGEESVELVVTRTGGQVGTVSVQYVTSNLTASSIDDVKLESGVITWDQGDTNSKMIDLTIRKDAMGAPLVEFVQVQLLDIATGSVYGTSVVDPKFSIAYVAVIDHDGVGSIQVQSEKTIFWESDRLANFTVARVGGSLGSVKCLVETIAQTALSGVDFLFHPLWIEWNHDDNSTQIVSVPIVDDDKYSLGSFFKSFDVRVSNCSSSTFVDPRYESLQLSIADDDASPGYASFEPITYDFFTKRLSGSLTNHSRVGAHPVILTVERKGGWQGNLTVQFQTIEGIDQNSGAKSGRDFTGKSGEIKWLEGDTTPKQISIPILIPATSTDPTSTPFLTFSVVLQNQSVFSDGFIQPIRDSVPVISAEISLEVTTGNAGRGYFTFKQSNYFASEDQGSVTLSVERVGGSTGVVTLKYETESNSAKTQLADETTSSWHCSSGETGMRRVQTVDGVREIYCDMSDDSALGGSASIFHWDTSMLSSTVLYDRQCLAVEGSGDLDNSILWADYTGRVGSAASVTSSTASSDYTSWQAFSAPRTGADLSFHNSKQVKLERPSVLGLQARPIPFPFNQRVVWFDWENSTIFWKNGLNQLVGNLSFASVGITDKGGMDDLANNFYFITDGISQVHVGNPSISSNATATLVMFDWLHDTVSSEQVSPLMMASSSWCTPDYDAFGHVLWTVNGRVMYKNCSYAGVQAILGGTIRDPMAKTDIFTFSKCPDSPGSSTLKPGCESWDFAGSNPKGGVDLFAHVDSSGFLYFGDRGSSGGLFGCSNITKPFGIVRTNIELGRRVNDDFVSKSGFLTWQDKDTYVKTFTIDIVEDGTRDDSLFEDLLVVLKDSSAGPSSIIDNTATITILDVDGAGVVDVVPEFSMVSERGECCQHCSGPERDRQWCSRFNVKRSYGRGPVCVDYALKGNSSDSHVVFSSLDASHLSAKIGQDVEEQNGTLCWGHADTTTQNLTIKFPYSLSFGLLHKRFAVETSGPSSSILQGALPTEASCPSNGTTCSATSRPAAPVVTASATQIVEDKDASPGYFTLNTDPQSGIAVISYATTAGWAELSVSRFGGSDLDVIVDFTTEMLAHEEIGVRTPFTTRVKDGTHGGNTFCLSNSSRIVGACVDSSTALSCGGGSCYLLEEKFVKPAQEATTLNDYPEDAHYIRTSGQLRWMDGEIANKPIIIPILPIADSQGDIDNTILPAFRVIISSVRASQSGLQALINLPPELPMRNVFGNCTSENCHIKSDGSLISPCDTDTCRRSETSEAIVILEPEQTAGILRLLNSSYFVSENVDPKYVIFTVSRVLGKKGRVTVRFSSFGRAVENVSVSAWEDRDFIPAAGMLVWEDDDTSDRYINISIIDDAEYIQGRAKRSFTIALNDATGGAVIEAATQTATLVIVDDDAVPGEVVFRYSRQSWPESVHNASIEVRRIGGTDLDIYVEVKTGQQSSWAPVFEQSGNSSAHSLLLIQQIYACATYLDGKASASAQTFRRGGGGPSRAFDFDPNTFWDSDLETDTTTKRLQFDFVNCNLEGAVVNAYRFVTDSTSAHSGCPSDWTFEGSLDGIKWVVIDKQANKTCTPDISPPFGSGYKIANENIMPYTHYRWLFSRDNNDRTAIKIYEALFFFAGEKSTLQPQICDKRGTCCTFRAGHCDPSGGFNNKILLQSSPDYVYTREVLSWKEGDNSSKTVSIPLLDDCMGCSQSHCSSFNALQDLAHEEFPIHIGLISDLEIAHFSGTNDAIYPFRQNPVLLPSATTSTISVVDDDGPGVLSIWSTSCGMQSGSEVFPFESIFGHEEGHDATCVILETVKTVEFMVTRTGSNRGPVSVEYSVDGVTATPYVDFVPTNGTLRWSHGDWSPKVFEVQILKTPSYTSGAYARSIKAKLLGNDLFHNGWNSGYQVVEGGAQLHACEKSVAGVCIDPSKAEFIVTIIDIDAKPGVAQIVLADQPPELQYVVDQANETASVFVQRNQGSDLAMFVHFETVQIDDDEARPCSFFVSGNCEYFNASGIVEWNDTDHSNKVISVRLGNSVMRRQFEAFKVRIWGRLNETLLNWQYPFCGGHGAIDNNRAFEQSLCDDYFESEVTVNIRRSGVTGYLGLISQAPWPFVVSDRLGYAIIAVDRLMGKSEVVSVDYTLEGDSKGRTAIAGKHFIANSGQLTWPDRDDAPKFIQIDVLQGSVAEDTAVDLDVRLRFHSRNTGVTFSQQTARLVIRSKDFTPQWKLKKISGSNEVLGELNDLTVEIQPNAVLGPFTSIIISGITSFQTPNATLAIGGPGAFIFGKTAIWNQRSGSLTLVVASDQSIPFAIKTTVSFVLRNADIRQSLTPTIVAESSVVCVRKKVNGVPLTCPEAVNITSVSMDGVLRTSMKSFSSVKAESRMCLEEECPHSRFFGSLNYVTTSFSSPVMLPPGTKIELKGLQSNQLQVSSTSVTFVNLSSDAGVGEYENQTRVCTCSFPRCSCEQMFTDIPRQSPVRLRIQLQCNAMGSGRSNGDTISVQVGSSKILSDISGLSQPSSSCENNCSKLHDLFDPAHKDVTNEVSGTGRLFVSITSSSRHDFCGKGEYLRAEMTLIWQRSSLTLLQVPANWSLAVGSLALQIPLHHRVDPGQIVSFTFALRNPNTRTPGSRMTLVAANATGIVIGPAQVDGLIMIADSSPEIEWASIQESSRLQGKSNRIGIGIKFNGPVGGTSDGIFVNVSGLVASNRDNLQLMVRSCSFCDFPFDQQQDLSKHVGDARMGRRGTAMWLNSDGQIQLWIRGPAPSFLIDDRSLSGMFTLTNPENTAQSDVGVKFDASELVDGTVVPLSRELKSASVHGTYSPTKVLRATVSAETLISASIKYSSAAYVAQDSITLDMSVRFNLQNTDKVSFFLPSLTTCKTFVNLNADSGCTPILTGTARLSNTKNNSGVPEGEVLFTWNESIRTLTLSPHGGSSTCSSEKLSVIITPTDYDCSKLNCTLKLLPDAVSSKLGFAAFTSDAFRTTCLENDCGSYCMAEGECHPGLKCKNKKDWHELGQYETCSALNDCVCSDPTGDFIAPASCKQFDMTDVPSCTNIIPVSSPEIRATPGSAWGRISSNFDSSSSQATGRAWFGVGSLNNTLFVYGGVARHGFAKTILTSRQYTTWRDHDNETFLGISSTDSAESGSSPSSSSDDTPFGSRAFFPSIDQDGYLWIFGGRGNASNSLMSDVWKTKDGRIWSLVTSNSTWAARYHHAAVSYAGKMWILGGASSDTTELNDVFHSSDGVQWTAVVQKSGFTARRGHSVVVYDGKMWLFGGYHVSNMFYSDVLSSVDGANWVVATSKAEWTPRASHSGFSFNNRLWLIGGNNDQKAFSDVWSSTDGSLWQLQHSNAHWGERYGSAAFVFSGRMWVIGGSSDPCLPTSDGMSACSGTVLPLDCHGAETSCTANEVWIDAFRPINVDYVQINQSSAVLGADNRIRVTAQFDSQIETGTVLEIVGFENVVADPIFSVSGSNASSFDRFGMMTAGSSRARFTVVAPIYARMAISFFFSVRNSLIAQNASSLWLEVKHEDSTFTDSRSLNASSLVTNVPGSVRLIQTVTSAAGANSVNFNFTVENSMMLEGLRMHLPRVNSSTKNTTISVYYMCGSHVDTIDNASNWCFLGSTNLTKSSSPLHTHNQTVNNSNITQDQFDFLNVSDLAHISMRWLGPQPIWAPNSNWSVSSAFGGHVNVSAVLALTSDGLWHSGSPNPSRLTCAHFPLCTESWVHNKNQWLAFDLGAPHTIAGIRTSFPAYTVVPEYIFEDNSSFSDMTSSLWEQAHFREFELQYSYGGFNGQWISALAGVAEKQMVGFQTHQFEPRSARYWRLLMKNNYGFPYIALKSLEFYGTSANCQQMFDSLLLELDQNGKIVPNGVGLSSGLHAFRVSFGMDPEVVQDIRQGNVGIQFSDVYTPSANFVVRRISGSNDIRDEYNILTLHLLPDRPLPNGTVVTISGLTGSQTMDPTISLAGANASLFGFEGSWDVGLSQLVLVSRAGIPTSLLTLSFGLQNGVRFRSPVRPVISASGVNVRISRISMTGNVLGVLSSPSPGLKLCVASESSRVQADHNNKITITVRSTVDILNTTVFNITSLKAHSTQGSDGIVEITAKNVDSISKITLSYAASGVWSSEHESIYFSLSGKGIPAFTNFSFSFKLRNTPSAQAPVFPIIRVLNTTGDLLPPATSSTSILSSSDVPTFTFAEITDSNKVLDAANNITVKLQPNLGIFGGSAITIIGLLGSTTGDGIVSVWSDSRLFREDRGVFAGASGGKITFQTLPNCTVLCPGQSCKESGGRCFFPFSYQGIVYHDCVKLQAGSPPVCSTQKVFNESAGKIGWANTSGWGYCPSLCDPTFPAGAVTQFKFQLINPRSPLAASVQTISVDDGGAMTFSNHMTSKNGVLNPRDGSKSLLLETGTTVMSRGKLMYLLSTFTMEAWVKLGPGAQAALTLFQVGDFAVHMNTSSSISIVLPVCEPTSSATAHTFVGITPFNETWHHVSVTWSNTTGNLTLNIDNGTQTRTIEKICQAMQMNFTGLLVLGSTSSAMSMQMTQVRLWRSTLVGGLFNYMIDPASVGKGLGSDLLAYYPFSAVDTFFDTKQCQHMDPGSDRSRIQTCGSRTTTQDLDVSKATIDTIPIADLFLDVYSI